MRHFHVTFCTQTKYCNHFCELKPRQLSKQVSKVFVDGWKVVVSRLNLDNVDLRSIENKMFHINTLLLYMIGIVYLCFPTVSLSPSKLNSTCVFAVLSLSHADVRGRCLRLYQEPFYSKSSTHAHTLHTYTTEHTRIAHNPLPSRPICCSTVPQVGFGSRHTQIV